MNDRGGTHKVPPLKMEHWTALGWILLMEYGKRQDIVKKTVGVEMPVFPSVTVTVPYHVLQDKRRCRNKQHNKPATKTTREGSFVVAIPNTYSSSFAAFLRSFYYRPDDRQAQSHDGATNSGCHGKFIHTLLRASWSLIPLLLHAR